MKCLYRWLSSTSGATSIEYAIIAGLIGLSIITSATNVGTEVAGAFTSVATGFNKHAS